MNKNEFDLMDFSEAFDYYDSYLAHVAKDLMRNPVEYLNAILSHFDDRQNKLEELSHYLGNKHFCWVTTFATGRGVLVVRAIKKGKNKDTDSFNVWIEDSQSKNDKELE